MHGLGVDRPCYIQANQTSQYNEDGDGHFSLTNRFLFDSSVKKKY